MRARLLPRLHHALGHSQPHLPRGPQGRHPVPIEGRAQNPEVDFQRFYRFNCSFIRFLKESAFPSGSDVRERGLRLRGDRQARPLTGSPQGMSAQPQAAGALRPGLRDNRAQGRNGGGLPFRDFAS